MLYATSNTFSQLPQEHPNLHSVQPGSLHGHSIEKTAHTDGHLPETDDREHQRLEILHAFRKGRLSCRSVTATKEKVYLSEQDKNPRPVYMILEGCVLNARSITSLGIMDPEPLACYKKNAISSELENIKRPVDSLEQKCIASLPLLITKMEEQTERKCWEVYKSATSGHLKPNGSFSLPKLKKVNHNKTPFSSEVVLSQYQKDQIKTYCITDEYIHLGDIFKNKRELEHAFNLPCLPLSIFSPSQGKLTVYFEEELNLQTGLLEKNEKLIEHLCMSTGIRLESFWKIMKTLPFPLKIETLQSLKFNEKDTGDTTAEIINILSNPDQYSIRKFRKIAPERVCNNLFYEGRYHYLTYILISSEIDRFTSIDKYNNKIDLDSFANTATSREALSLFHELLRKGCPIDNTLDDIADAPIFFDSAVARYYGSQGVGIAFSFKNPNTQAYMCDSIFYNLPENSAGRTVSIDQAFSNCSHDEIQASLEQALTMLSSPQYNFNPRLNNIFLSLFYYGADPNPFKQKLTEDHATFKSEYPGSYFEKFGEISPSESVNSIISLWQNRETHPYYINWPKKVEIAQQEIIRLKQSIGLPESDQCMDKTSVLMQNKAPFQFLIDALSKPLILSHARDDNETILQIFDHYYRRPGPQQVSQYLVGALSLPGIWKSSHPCSHALRARNNVHWYMELLARFQVMHFSKQEKALLSLAMIYHDAAAEDVTKDKEESVSASYFKRDLAGHFPQPLLAKVALALESKEDDVYGEDNKNPDPQVRNYLRVLRFGDRMDFIRCSTISHDYPNLSGQARTGVFDPGRLDLPPAAMQNEAFQRHLVAAMHGAADLASITGGLKKGQDLRVKLDYASRHNLEPNNKNLTLSFERTPLPVMVMDRFLDNMVRIKIAREAGLHTCLDPEHQQCQADPIRGVTRGIHNSWYDLKQINLPEGMTPLEKMQCEHSLDVLRESTRQAMQTEVARLKQVGIPMNLGTLTQETLKSPEAWAVLERRGIRVVQEQRPRGFKPSGERNFETLFVPQERLPSSDTKSDL